MHSCITPSNTKFTVNKILLSTLTDSLSRVFNRKGISADRTLFTVNLVFDWCCTAICVRII